MPPASAFGVRRLVADVSLALGGAAVTGFILASHAGPIAMAINAATIAAIVFGMTAVMVPPLYIAATGFNVAPPAEAFLERTSGALRATGLVLLGLAPPLAFLVATSAVQDTVWLLGNGVAGLAGLLGVRSLWYSLFLAEVPGTPRPLAPLVEGAEPRRGVLPRRPMLLYLLWLTVGGAITSSLFQKTFE